MKSKIDCTIALIYDQMAISLVCHGHHAIILIERIDEYGEYQINKADFLPYDKNRYCVLYGMDLNQLLWDETHYGLVRHHPITDESGNNPIGASAKRSDIFDKLHLSKYYGITWSVTNAEAFRMINEITKPQFNNYLTCPRFNIKGYDNNGGVGHNCCSWAINVLHKANITLNQEYISNSMGITSLALPQLPLDPLEPQKCIIQ